MSNEAIKLMLAVTLGGCALAADLDEPRGERDAVFEFTEKPRVTRDGDRVTIAFASKGFCDATVAIEDAGGRIVRHLVSGVLGPKAPQPFRPNSLEQAVVWDGKNDQGNYIEDKDALSVRVSLGLRAQFERTLFWSPRKRTPQAQCPVRLAAGPEGVYVYDGGLGEHLRLFDHEGKYARTVYPFPADRLAKVEGLTRRTFAGSGGPVPVKWGVPQATLLNWNSTHPLETWPAGGGHGVDGNLRIGLPATALAVANGRIALVGERLNRFAADGSSGGMRVHGPGAGFEVVLGGPSWRGGGRRVPAAPLSAALSPDGQWLYLAGYSWTENWDTAGWRRDWLHGVARLRLDGTNPAELFAGSMKQGDSGTSEGTFGVAACVACDGQGRVYVGDHMNDRIQVFSPEGKMLRSLPAAKPARLAIDARSGEVWVFSWLLRSYLLDKARDTVIKATLTRLGTLERPGPAATWDLPIRGYKEKVESWDGAGGTQYEVALDLGTEPPSVWLADGGGLRIFAVEKDKLVYRRDFAEDLRKEICQPRPPYHGRQRLHFDPRKEQLYVAEQHYPVAIHSKAVWDLVQIEPATGRGQIVRMPCSAEDIAFDSEGNAYLRTITEFARFEPSTWREVPFDYGVALKDFGYQHGTTLVRSSIQTHGEGGSAGQIGGIALSPKGNLAVTLINRGAPEDRRGEKALSGAKQYEPRIFPGRLRSWEVHVFDKFGQRLYEDAVTGIGHINGIGMDKDDFLYVQASARPGAKGDTAASNPLSDTLIKLDPRKTRIVTNGGPLPLSELPKRPPDLILDSGTSAWVEGMQWMHPGVGLCAKARSPYGDCFCEADSRFALDYFARSFASETQSYRIVVLDANGNVITRIGRYGNVDDGQPLAGEGGPANPRRVGGDEVALMHVLYLAVHTDRRLFLADLGNYRLLSVKLSYHAEEKVALKEVADRR